ncbi:hypothetical protein [Enterococcus mediterraneensis]|uniref:hypothetical protein n=1 Tax=Enterococcus mediterraneensis TaxID=2364791 RepID=UPI0013DFCD4B|nr:hypothetical protein [Enterococcus mediterraneensis]
MEEEKFDGTFAGLGMIPGILIGLAKENLVLGLFLGVIIGIALDWLANILTMRD